MPSFDLMNKVELFVRTGTFFDDATQRSRQTTKAASKRFIYKDDCLWRSYKGRLLKVVRSDEEVRKILTCYHDDSNHAGKVRMVKEIMMMYYWVGVTEAVNNWIKSCTVCLGRTKEPSPVVQFCLAYGCDASSFICPDLRFYRFPKEAEPRLRWLQVAQRDEASLRSSSVLCSRHFEASCFTLGEDGQLTLSPEAEPTIVPAEEDPVPSDDEFLHPSTLDDLVATAAESSGARAPARPEVPAQLQEHQYCLPPRDAHPREIPTARDDLRRKTILQQSFSTYDQIARYLSHRVLPPQSKRSRNSLKRMAKRFGLIDGVLMYTRVSPPVRVLRSRDEVNRILQQFHDNQGHCGHGLCQREITKRFFWSSVTRDLACWISNCTTCLGRKRRKWLRCSVLNCNNCCGPVERGLGLTFHKFPLDDPALLARWLKAVGRANWFPRLWSSICSNHFTDDCLDRGGETVVLRPHAVPSLLVHSTSTAYFAKYDAVELYLRKRTYPPGLSYVEKNTFRRFCKKFVIKDDLLHVVMGERERVVLRSTQQVEVALGDYHNELNHLDTNKCLRLLSDRYFWKSMRPDVVQWINNCPECSRKKRKKPESSIQQDSDSCMEDNDDDDDDNDDCDDDGGDVADEGRVGFGGEDGVSPPAPPARLLPGTPSTSPTGAQEESLDSRGSARTLHYARVQEVNEPPADPPSKSQTPSSAQTTRLRSQDHHRGGLQRPAKRSRDQEAGSSSTRTSGCGPRPPSIKPRSALAIVATPPPQVDSAAEPRRLQARTVVQLCTQAKVKTKPALDGTDAQWVEIQEGMVVYVCFFEGATEDVIRDMANSLMTTKLFRKDTGRLVSVLDLPGSVLLVPQDSLLGQPGPRRRVEFRGGCEPWRGAQLFSKLVLTCAELLPRGSGKGPGTAVRVEHGVYGQKQEMVLNSAEPLTLLLDF